MEKNCKICFIDDDPIYKMFMKRVIEMNNLVPKINVTSFDDGDQAYNFINKNKQNPEELPDVILLDINMPVMDGFQFIEEYSKIKPKINKQIAVFMVTSSIDPSDMERSKKFSEISDYITKPVPLEKLKHIIGSFG